MKISYNWIKDLLPALPASPDQVAEKLTMHSYETRVVGTFQIPVRVVAVKIVKIEQHPNADRLHLATVTDGKKDIVVVCGAPNVAEGQIAPFSPVGTILNDETGGEFEVTQATIRGVSSPGMLNSLRELGVHGEHEGIWLLPTDTALGHELQEIIPNDTILETEMTPNRAHDSLSHVGVARELAALYGISLVEPDLIQLPKAETLIDGITIKVADANLSPRYLGAAIDNLKLAPSPLWMQARLLAVGGKPINNLVDITNYVTYEYGNPSHLFDRQKLSGATIEVRPANSKEQITLLDGTSHQLEAEDIIIAIESVPVALAGIMGGVEHAISNETSKGFLEVANFRGFSVQETSHRLPLITESSARFSKGLDPNLVETSTSRLLGLMIELAGASIQGVIDIYPRPWLEREIAFNPKKVSIIAGQTYEANVVKSALERLRFRVNSKITSWQVSVPTDRLDIEAEHDLIEEVIRLIGLEVIDAAKLILPATHSLSVHQYGREVVRKNLAELGLTETLNYSFEPENYAEIANVQEREHVSLVSPQAPELKNLRVSLLPGLFKNLALNREYFQRDKMNQERALFEIGRVYRPGDGGRVPGVIEEENVAGVVVGNMLTLDDIGKSLAAALGIGEMHLDNIVTREMILDLKYRTNVIGFEINLSELTSKINLKIPQPRSLADIQSRPIAKAIFKTLPRFPAVLRDLSMLVSPDVSVEKIQEIIDRVGGKLVAEVDLFDQYDFIEDPKAQEHTRGTKSYAFHVTYQAKDRTLENSEINAIQTKIMQALEDEIGAELRS